MSILLWDDWIAGHKPLPKYEKPRTAVTYNLTWKCPSCQARTLAHYDFCVECSEPRPRKK
jgi:hypothetical protein